MGDKSAAAYKRLGDSLAAANGDELGEERPPAITKLGREDASETDRDVPHPALDDKLSLRNRRRRCNQGDGRPSSH